MTVHQLEPLFWGADVVGCEQKWVPLLDLGFGLEEHEQKPWMLD